VLLYWSIGRDILSRQQEQGWGAKVIDRLSLDLRRAFPDTQGFSPRNLKYMRAFAQVWQDEAIVQQVAAQIPWFHNCVLLNKVKDPQQRLWYVQATQEYGWSRAVLEHQIETGLYARQGKALTNFERTLPSPQSDLAQQTLKDPLNFDFLTLHQAARERELQEGLIAHIRQFLLELGKGFAFVGSPYPLEVGGDEFEIDMLFYHLKLRAYVVIDLKIGKFSPEDAGQMNFYLSAVDDLLRHPEDAPSIGLILCKSRNEVVAEYALRDVNKPIGVATHLTREIEEALPQEFQYSLPTVEEIEAELAGSAQEEGSAEDTDRR
jgi:predicted nuclease of restriction endonuclease-like (RecB) superfamily